MNLFTVRKINHNDIGVLACNGVPNGDSINSYFAINVIARARVYFL